MAAATALGHPKNVGGVAVAYLVEAKELYLIGMDPKTGKELWRQLASPGQITPGIPVTVQDVDDKVVYMRPERGDPRFTRLVIADPKTGADIVVSGPAIVSSSLSSCGADVCTTARRSVNARGTLHRLRVADGKLAEEPAQAAIPAGARSIGDGGLLDLGIRSPQREEFALFSDNKVRWRIPVTDAFPPGYSTDYGWRFHHYESQKLIVGNIYPDVKRAPDSSFTRQLEGRAAAAGISTVDGSVLWKEPGADLFCRGAIDVEDPATEDLIPVRCRYRGIETYDGKTRQVSHRDLSVTVEGFSPTTGKTTWTVDAGPADLLVEPGNGQVTAGRTTVMARFGAEPLAIDIATGKTTVPASDATFWCPRKVEFKYRVPMRILGDLIYDRYGEAITSICDTKGEPATQPPPSSVTRSVGTNFDDITIVATKEGFTAYRTEPA
nr:hypothetical protein [Phytohabitans flavus]